MLHRTYTRTEFGVKFVAFPGQLNFSEWRQIEANCSFIYQFSMLNAILVLNGKENGKRLVFLNCGLETPGDIKFSIDAFHPRFLHYTIFFLYYLNIYCFPFPCLYL